MTTVDMTPNAVHDCHHRDLFELADDGSACYGPTCWCNTPDAAGGGSMRWAPDLPVVRFR